MRGCRCWCRRRRRRSCLSGKCVDCRRCSRWRRCFCFCKTIRRSRRSLVKRRMCVTGTGGLSQMKWSGLDVTGLDSGLCSMELEQWDSGTSR